MTTNPTPDWIARHHLHPGKSYSTDDSDLILQYLGYAQVRDDFGFQYVMVFRERGKEEPLLTLVQRDADACAGFTLVPERPALERRPPGHDN